MTDVTLRSFDIFDTLVARRCVEPHAVFRMVEARSSHAGFAGARIKAEATVAAKGDYDLAAIYRALVAGGVSQVAAARLQALELETEFAELIPIREHLAEVRPGDLLISDMYLPRAFIERVVRQTCGLHFNPLYLTSHGKRSGRAWESLGRALTIAEHLGDNLHSDIEMCRRSGVQARHTEVAKLTAGEALVAEMGFRELALSMREARLALWSDDPGELALGRAQIEVNFPLLFLTGLLLIEAATRIGWNRLLFSSRDCFLLYNLVRRLSDRLGVDIASSYFFTSRVARVFPSDAYINYFNSLCVRGETAAIDICGTGWSLTRLFEAAGQPDTEMVLVNRVVNPKLAKGYQGLGPTERPPRVKFMTEGGYNIPLEALNTADHRMVADVIEVDGVFVPTFVDLDASPRYDQLVRFSTRAFDLALAATDRIGADQLFAWFSTVRPAHVDQIYRTMGVTEAATAENLPIRDLLAARREAQMKPPPKG